jgi:hypothetical protein
MKMTMKLRDDILALLKLVQEKKDREGDPWSDSRISTLCFKHGEFVGRLRAWTGGPGSVTLEKAQVFENFLRDQIGDAAYNDFVAQRRKMD